LAVLRAIICLYVALVLVVFIYPVHYVDFDGKRMDMGRQLLFKPAAPIYQRDRHRSFREVVLLT